MRISVNLNDYQKANEKKKEDEETGEDKNELVKNSTKYKRTTSRRSTILTAAKKSKNINPRPTRAKRTSR